MEVDVAAVQAGEFAPSAAGPAGGDDQQSLHLVGGRQALLTGVPEA
ncbi:hypothetical protein [Amycolatopsis taiwanensis]|nr:hypothetical protein [Amycolatopsis taiwanensis]